MTHSVRPRLHRRWGRARAVGVLAVAVVIPLAACSSTTGAPAGSGPSPATGSSNGSPVKEPPIPASAFQDTTGLTGSTVTVGNISTLFAGLFKGADVGTEAYAAYVNAQGGVDGRRIVVDSYDDGYQGGPNKQETQAAVAKDFALVGGFSLQDNFGGTVLAANPGVPNVTVSLDDATANLPNTFSPDPAAHGWPLGPLAYFQSKFPAAVTKAGALVADQPSAISKWNDEKATMEHLGYKVVYDNQFDITQVDFTQNVVAMRNAGVKILFIEQMPQNYAAAVIKDLDRQNFHPIVVLGASTYSEALVPNAGGAAAIDGAYLEQPTSLFLGEDASAIPAVSTFLTWVQKVAPGFKPDLYTLFGWVSAELFAQALRTAGPHPTRGSVLQALRGITTFSGNNLIAPANPAGKIPANCYVIARITNGKFQRLDDPPTTGPTHGYRCDQPFYYTK